MTFVEAFRAAVAGQRVRRVYWNESAWLTASPAGTLICWGPARAHWAGAWEPTLNDVEAEDWIADEMP